MAKPTSNRPIWIVSGTRPEVIKLAPVLVAARARFGADAVQWISTGQHMQFENRTLDHFGIVPNRRVTRRSAAEAIVEFDAHLIGDLTRLQQEEKPGLVIVQGDTASTFSAAFAAFHAGIPVAHVEAGLRTGSIRDPFPEEAYRRMTDVMAALHFAPTALAARNLAAEGYSPDSVFRTGNTSVDAQGMALDLANGGQPGTDVLPPLPPNARLLFVTVHRRESWGRPIEQICLAVLDLVRRYEDVFVVLPMHVNPVVRDTVTRVLSGHERVHLTEPFEFADAQAVIRKSYLVLTDSGGLSEEAPTYAVPTLILRNATERPEALEAGVARLAGTDREQVFAAACKILDDPREHAAMSTGRNPFGDGHAAERIALGIERFLAGEGPVLHEEEQFA